MIQWCLSKNQTTYAVWMMKMSGIYVIMSSKSLKVFFSDIILMLLNLEYRFFLLIIRQLQLMKENKYQDQVQLHPWHLHIHGLLREDPPDQQKDALSGTERYWCNTKYAVPRQIVILDMQTKGDTVKVICRGCFEPPKKRLS